jgi:hypothetical protein
MIVSWFPYPKCYQPTYKRLQDNKSNAVNQGGCDVLVKLSGVNASIKEFPFTIPVVAMTNFRPDTGSVIFLRNDK